MSYRGEVVINRPVSEVFEYITDVEKFPEWSATNFAKRLTEGPDGVGSRSLVDMGKWPMKSRNEFETVEWEPNRKWAFKTVSPSSSLIWEGNFIFEAAGPSSTMVKAEGSVSLTGWRKVLEPMLRGELQKGEQKELDVAKGLLESGPGAPA